jgi:acyl-coenzyme A synthetase/AMP-(fatty) acid ligase
MWLWALAGQASAGSLHGARVSIKLRDLAGSSSLGGRLEDLRGRTVLLATRDQLTAALALLELDGVARRIVLCPPDLAAEHFPGVIATAGADAWVRDQAMPGDLGRGIATTVLASPELERADVDRIRSQDTEWILLTSGTTGAPKLVLHTFASLMSAIHGQAPAVPPVWSTFYDIRRYGGLQIFLRAVYAGSLVLSSPAEPVNEFLARCASYGVSHISGTPSHWRAALMSGTASKISPRYVRLSGEIADQGILDHLRAAFPGAVVAHAFASTEAGVAFEVTDGRAGFPESLVGASAGGVEMKVDAGTLRIRSPGNAQRYLGDEASSLRGADGFVDTGDQLELCDGRYLFRGRSGGIINVGGLKVHPEEVEAVINAHPWVRMSLVKARRNPITGAVVSADVVLVDRADRSDPPPESVALTREIIERCRRALAPHKVPAMIRIVPTLEVSPSGKLVRPNA